VTVGSDVVVRVLVTGMSGTGKSSVLRELAQRGHRVVDTDDPGWSEEVPLPDGSGTETLWLEDRMSALLGAGLVGSLFVSGCTANQGRFYDRFDAVALLVVPVGALLDRIATRTTNSFGKSDVERDRILRDVEEIEPLLRATATVEIDAGQPLRAVVDAVEALVPKRA
jgi:predicted ATPase